MITVKIFEEKYGFSFPEVHITEHSDLNATEYLILINGIEAGRSTLRMGYHLCMDTGKVTEELDYSSCDRTKDPAFELDAFYVPKEDIAKYVDAGYACASPEQIISFHLFEIIRKNRTKILDQNLIKNLIEKVRKQNPDVITDVFVMHKFSISDFRILLNYLLEEEVSIRDMNTIIETIADNIQKCQKIYKLAEKVRQNLSYSVVQNYIDENKELHAFRISKDIAQLLLANVYYPPSKTEIPHCVLELKDEISFFDSISKPLARLIERNLTPVLVCKSNVRHLLAYILHRVMPGILVISDVEMYALRNDITITVEGEVTLKNEDNRTDKKMKCDIVIYSNTAAVGLFLFLNWYDAPSVMFVYEAKQYNGNNSTEWTEKSLQEIKTLGEYCVKNDILTFYIKKYYQAGALLDDCFLMSSVAKLFAILITKICPEGTTEDYYIKRKLIYTDLMKYCQLDMALVIIEKLLVSGDEYDLTQGLRCEKILFQQIGIEKIIIPYSSFKKKTVELEKRYKISQH
ncbi:MAG: FHIPEP family type III secretion protein [Spirochaetaceae bacterium]|nr:FHIPEP family type III secretion protein [Spirochaetaceae bacterium]